MSKVVRFKSFRDRSVDSMLEHLNNEKPDTGFLVTRVGDFWRWDFFGEATVAELIGAIETAKRDIMNRHEYQDEVKS